MCYVAYMSVNVSVRLDDDLAELLRLRARAAGETLSDRLRRYAEEGARREEHPLITFRDGPTGRRAGLLGGPDVWEVAMWVDDLAAEPDPVATLLQDSGLSRSQVEAALRYRAAYPDEITARVGTASSGNSRRCTLRRLTAGQHHPGVLIAPSSRFSRRPAGVPSLVKAILHVADQQLTDRVIYLQPPTQPKARKHLTTRWACGRRDSNPQGRKPTGS